MKRNKIFAIGLLCLLAGCGSTEQTIVQPMVIRSDDASRTMSLIQATERVMQRRMAAASIKNGHATTVPTGTNSATLTLTLPDAAAVTKAKAILGEPFSFDLRIEKPKTNLAKNEPKISDWIPTTLTGSNLLWVQPVGNNATGEVSIELQFTEKGRKILESVFRENKGEHMGIFVRDLLVSKLSVGSGKVGDRILIGGIPSSKVAEIFADDVNTGLFVSFTNP